MNKWLPIVAGIVVLAAVLLVARFVSDSEIDSPGKEQTPARQAIPITSPEAEAVADPSEPTRLDSGAGFDRDEYTTGGATAVPATSQNQVAGSVGRVEQDVAGSGPDTGGHDMPGLVMPASDSTGAGTGPSQDKFGMPGPEMGGDVTSAGPRGPVPEAVLDRSAPQPDTDSLIEGPSQVDLGLPGPGEPHGGLIESSDSGADLMEEPDGDQALPSQ